MTRDTFEAGSTVEDRVLLAVRDCCERYGTAKVTIDDVARVAKVSRATIYRMFPGGKDVLFDALRDPPAYLAPGDLVRFEPIRLEDADGHAGAAPDW